MPIPPFKATQTPKHPLASVDMLKNVQLHVILLIQILARHLLSIRVDDAFHHL